MPRKREKKKDFVKLFREEFFIKYNDEKRKRMTEKQLTTMMAEFEDGLSEAVKKQEEYDSIGESWAKLADNVLIQFQFQDEVKIQEKLNEKKRELGFLLDEEEQAMREKMTPFQLKSLKETREKIKNGVEYTCTYKKDGFAISSIGTPNPKVVAQLISTFAQEMRFDKLRPETQKILFLESLKTKK